LTLCAAPRSLFNERTDVRIAHIRQKAQLGVAEALDPAHREGGPSMALDAAPHTSSQRTRTPEVPR